MSCLRADVRGILWASIVGVGLAGCAAEAPPRSSSSKGAGTSASPAAAAVAPAAPTPGRATANEDPAARAAALAGNVAEHARALGPAVERLAASAPSANAPAAPPAATADRARPGADPFALLAPDAPEGPAPTGISFLDQPARVELSIGPKQEESGPVRTWEGLLEMGSGESPVANQPLAVLVRTGDVPAPTASPTPPTPPTTAPAAPAAAAAAATVARADVPPSLRDASSPPPVAVEDLALRLQRQLRQDPRGLVAHLEYQLYQYLLGRPVPAMESISTLPADEREVLSALMDALVNFRATATAQENGMLAAKVRPLLDLGERLRATADLRVPSVVLCTRVDAYGRYEPVPSNRFVAGRRHEVIVYCDVENVTSRTNAAGLWESSLSQETEILDDAGKPVWKDRAMRAGDVCRHRRRDFYVARRAYVPETLPPGKYVLKVTIVDQLAQRLDQQGVELVITER